MLTNWRRRILLLIIVAASVALSTVAFLHFRERQPHYGGRSLRDWLVVYHDDPANVWPRDPSGVGSQTKEAANAVRQIGTNALPWLLKWAPRENEHDIRSRVAHALLIHCTRNTVTAAFVQGVIKPRAEVNGDLAIDGFRILGPQASSAVPYLIRLMQNTNAPDTCFRSEMLLACIGEKGLPPLLAVLTNPKVFQWPGAAVPWLVQAQQDPDGEVRQLATNALRTTAAQN